VELETVIFVTNNEGKHREVERLLAGTQIRFQRMDLAGHEGVDDVEALARLRVTEAYGRLKQPCFVERSGLFLRYKQRADLSRYRYFPLDMNRNMPEILALVTSDPTSRSARRRTPTAGSVRRRAGGTRGRASSVGRSR